MLTHVYITNCNVSAALYIRNVYKNPKGVCVYECVCMCECVLACVYACVCVVCMRVGVVCAKGEPGSMYVADFMLK